MADSIIAVSGLAATGGVGQIALNWTVGLVPCLPYLMLDKVEIWEAATNNRAAATKVGEVFSNQFVRTGLGRSVTRYYWARARDVSGNWGDYFPASATAGISGTTTSNAPNAEVLSDVSSNAGNISAGNITGVVITGSVIRTAPSGARIEIDAASNSIEVIPSGNTPSAILRAIVNNTVLAIATSVANALVTFQNNGAFPALRASGNATTPAVVDVDNLGGGAGRDAGRFRNVGSGGGVLFLGRSAANGGYAAYAQSGGFGPFTGQHEALIEKAEGLDIGDIVNDEKVISRNGVDDTLTAVRVSSAAGQRAALGVVSRRSPLDPSLEFAALPRSPNEKSSAPSFLMRCLAERYDLLTVNSLGEGQINVCGRAGNINKGDLLVSSSMRGKAERQGGDAVLSFTVARAREDVIFDHPDQWRRVACIYLCG